MKHGLNTDKDFRISDLEFRIWLSPPPSVFHPWLRYRVRVAFVANAFFYLPPVSREVAKGAKMSWNLVELCTLVSDAPGSDARLEHRSTHGDSRHAPTSVFRPLVGAADVLTFHGAVCVIHPADLLQRRFNATS